MIPLENCGSKPTVAIAAAATRDAVIWTAHEDERKIGEYPVEEYAEADWGKFAGRDGTRTSEGPR
ncbi:MAG: hypothetical protein K2X93_27010 [Candidatus Obscuribacterales bacterium]|nr:hypothetical protein [Candidatus Obscuribacterales bacterium]